MKIAHPDIIDNILPGRVELSVERLEALGLMKNHIFTFGDLDRNGKLKTGVIEKPESDEFFEHDV